MNWYRANSLALAISVGYSAFADAQAIARASTDSSGTKTDTVNSDPLGSWMSSHQLAIRQTFNGSKDEQKPASVFFNKVSSGTAKDFAVIDAAVKVSQWQVPIPPPIQLLLFPTAEYHRNTSQSKASQTASGALNVEFRPVGLTVAGMSQSASFWPVAPAIFATAKLARDLEKKKVGDDYSGMLTITSNMSWFPGTHWVTRDGQGVSTYRGTYYLYAGVELFRSGMGSADTTAKLGVARLWAEGWPIAFGTRQYLQLTGDLTYRWRVGGNLAGGRDIPDLALGANFWLDGQGHVGLGLQYSRGHDSANDFLFREQTAIGAKLKF
jgi:hypothetical protein